MEYDKRSYQKTNDKKVLHKIRKHWVVVSTALLMALGGGAAATHVSANADTTNANNGSNASSTNTIKERLNQQLQTPQKQQNTNRQASVNNNNNGENNNQNNNSQNESIINEAKVLHSRIVSNAGQNIANQQQTNNNTAQSDVAGQGRVSANAPKVNSNVHVNKLNGASDIAKRINANENNGMTTANANNNQIDVTRRPKQLLGDIGQSYEPYGPLKLNVGATGPSSDVDGLMKESNGFKYDGDTQTFYQDGYSDSGISDTNATDKNGKHYGYIIVQYVDPSDDNRIVAQSDLGPAHEGTDFSQDKASFLKNYPQSGPDAQYGYSIVPSTGETRNGKNYPQIDSGAGITQYNGGQYQVLAINLHRNGAPKAGGQVLIQYIDQSDGNRILSYRINSDSDGKPFNQSDFIKNGKAIPQGYKYVNYNTVKNGIENPTGTDAITNYVSGKVQTLNVLVQSTNQNVSDQVNYDYNGSVISSRPISGTNGSSIDYNSDLNVLLPQNYDFVSDVHGDPQTFAKGMGPVNIDVKPISNNNNVTPPKISDGTMTIHYRESADHNDANLGGKDISTVVVHGTGSFTNASEYEQNVPSGWQMNSTDTANNNVIDSMPTSSFIANKNQDWDIYLNKVPGYKPKMATAYIQYITYDPKHKIFDITSKIGNPHKITGHAGDTINYAPYDEYVPQGYRFVENYDTENTIEDGHTNYIAVANLNDLAQPIYINYIDTEGSNVDTTADTQALNGSYGQSYAAKSLASNSSDGHTLASGYSLDPSEDNQIYSIGSDKQTVNILVDGQAQGKGSNPSKPNHDGSTTHSDTNPSDLNNLVVDVTQNIMDHSDHQNLGHKNFKYSVVGTTGQIRNINPNSFVPAPSSDYSTTTSDAVDAFTIGNHELDVNGGNNVKQDPSHKNEIDASFNYIQKNAMATVTYEDQSDGNAIVGSDVIKGVPNSAMDYTQLNSNVPYGYSYKADGTNPHTLVNGANYIIYVGNAHLQPKPTVTPRNGYGYITINYGQNLSTNGNNQTTGTIYSTVTTSQKKGTQFPFREATNPTTKGGLMPDVYSDAQTTNSDNSISTYSDTPHTYNVDVDQNSSTQQVSDAIDYEVIESDGNEDVSDTSNLQHSNMTPVMTKGTDGTYIDYVPYTNNVPKGYYYAGMAPNSTIYTQGQNNQNNPVATIYLKKASENTNACNNYTPENDNNHVNSDGNEVPTTNVKKSDGYYWPGANAPVTAENPNKLINKSGYNWDASKHTMPSDYEGDNNGDVPNGYAPAWVKNDQGKYVSGYVPSDIIPANYIPGIVPNGRGGYVAGYVPSNPSNMPSGNQSDGHGGTQPIPPYVPGNVPSGHKDKNGNEINVPGYVPNVSPYSTADGKFMIQYVDANNPSDVISDVESKGQVGKTLTISDNGNGKQYINDVPVGYTDPTDMGESVNGSRNFNPSASHTYTYADANNTLRIGVRKLATGDIIYQDSKSKAQVGYTQINGADGDSINFDKGQPDHKYVQLLPYGYTNAQPEGGMTHTLENGQTYIIDVDKKAVQPSKGIQPQSDVSQMIVNYVYTDQQGNKHTVGTNSFTGKKGTNLMPPAVTGVGTDSSQGGYIPYGYQLANNTDYSKVQTTKFNQDNQDPVTLTVNVKKNPSETGPHSDTDVIAYEVANSDGTDVPLDYTKDGKGFVPQNSSDQNDSGNPLTFTVRGQDGTSINYTPYQDNVPDGYSFDGMGNNWSSTIDSGHTTSSDADTILLQQARPQVQLGTITVNYLEKNGSSNTNIDTITLNGLQGTPFTAGYYEDNLPTAASDDDFVSASDAPFTFNGSNQTMNVYVKKNPANAAQYSNITIHFVKADDQTLANAENDIKSTDPTTHQTGVDEMNGLKVPNSNDEVMSGRVGDIFTPYAYEYNVPANTTFDHIAYGDTIDSFGNQDQDVYIAVNPTDGSF